MKPLLITMGDPTGIGPELIIKTLLDGKFANSSRPIEIVGDINILAQAGNIFGCRGEIEQLQNGYVAITFGTEQLIVRPCSNLDPATTNYGKPDLNCGKAMADYIEHAISRCLDGTAAGIVTCPINKAAINTAGFHFPGHTELLADRCRINKVVMMLAGERLKVCLVTTHLAHRDITANLNQAEIVQTIRITATAFRNQFGIKNPRLAVLALNPHASEDGLFGDEEERIIAPAIATTQAEGINATGPHSADTLFHFAAKGKYDAVICMYHDQGLIPLKLLHFDDAVNVTLGLPIVRTSVDHGTAYDLAGTGTASTASLVAAIKMAEQMAKNRKNTSPQRH